MSVVIIGGNERMERQYQQICKDFLSYLQYLSNGNVVQFGM